MKRDGGASHDSSDDDGAPDEVTFEDSKATALRSAREAAQAAKREKERFKEWRRKRQQFFLEQKKKRLLPEDVLEEIGDFPVQKLEVSEGGDEQAVGVKAKPSAGVKRAKVRRLQANCSVMRAKDQDEAASRQQAAVDFIQARLYGPGSRRMTNNQLLSIKSKRAVHKGAAVQFMNKSKGAELRAKAEKCNKRWIHKKKLI
ncbi:nucleolar protein 7 [Denticeps clupeoides]|uniref:U3 small nucleolar RNA-associated protein NOL7 C-terminal domain-containing protein n=1 Tax=Denticeps clupeoides TaxID=299321 RepID=A0AAY4B5W4_9TELE|nr:nucleolar protein 7 [Denticeps clupeoides]